MISQTSTFTMPLAGRENGPILGSTLFKRLSLTSRPKPRSIDTDTSDIQGVNPYIRRQSSTIPSPVLPVRLDDTSKDQKSLFSAVRIAYQVPSIALGAVSRTLSSRRLAAWTLKLSLPRPDQPITCQHHGLHHSRRLRQPKTLNLSRAMPPPRALTVEALSISKLCHPSRASLQA